MQIEGFTALHCACQQGHVKVVQVLVQAGANLNIQMLLVCSYYTIATSLPPKLMFV